MGAFLGMRGTGDWVANQRPESWRETLLRLYPNGRAPLTAIMSMLRTEVTDDPAFHWWTKALANQRAAITGVYTDSGLSTSYVHRATSGTTLYIKMSEDDSKKFMVGHQVLLRCSFDPTVDVTGKVSARSANGASSYIAVTLLEADDNSDAYDLSDADVALIIGSVFSEGSNAPSSIMYDPVEYYNYTQIFRNTLEHTRTAMMTRLRTGDQVKEAKRECLELHGVEMEKAFIFGKRTSGTGDNGKPERTTQGLRGWIVTNRFNFPEDNATWLAESTLDWIENRLEEIFRFGSSEKLLLCGSGAVLGINQLIRKYGTFEYTPQTASYGIKVWEWVTPFGILYVKTHPLFTYEATLRHSGIVIDTKNIVYRPLKGSDTKYQPKLQDNDLDGEKSGYLTEAGLEVHHEETFAWFDGLGLNNYGGPSGTTTTGTPTTTATTEPPTTPAP